MSSSNKSRYSYDPDLFANTEETDMEIITHQLIKEWSFKIQVSKIENASQVENTANYEGYLCFGNYKETHQLVCK